ncbi:MAG: hypothetical protein PVJ42_05285 [bacterium]
MTSDGKRDLNITHAVVNTLTSGYQGKFVFLNSLKQMGSPRYSPAEFDQTRDILDKIGVWIKAVMDGRPVLAGPGTESSAERTEALDLLRALKDDLSGLAAELLRMRADNYVADDPNQAELLVASLCRHAYARDHYVKGLVAYSEKFEYEEAADRWRQHLIHTPQEIKVAHQFLEELQDTSRTGKKFYVDLFEETLLIPYIFSCQVQDMNQVLSFYTDGFTYEDAGISLDEAARWKNMNARPEAACYWHAYGFTADETAAWIEAGFFEPGMAANWKYRDFGPADASRWHGAGFDARGAMVSIVMGQTDPQAARAWLEAAQAAQQEGAD